MKRFYPLFFLVATHILPPGWTELPMKLTQIDTGITPTIWGINDQHNVFVLEQSNKLIKIEDEVPIRLHHVSAGQSGVWGVGLYGNVFIRREDTVPTPQGKFKGRNSCWQKHSRF